MKNIFFIIGLITILLSSCKKEEIIDTTLHGTRLKTYTKSYGYDDRYVFYHNSFNKIDRVENLFEDGSIYKTAKCIYHADHSLDSIIIKYGDGTLYDAIDITCNNFRIIKVYDNIYTYNNDGEIIEIEYISGYYSYEYSGDSVSIYDNPNGFPKTFFSALKFSSTIKNPFFITGFESEFCIINNLIPWLRYTSNVPYSLTQLNSAPYIFNYTYEGDFNGYPTSRSRNDGVVETFTYEEF